MSYFGPIPSPSPINEAQISFGGDARYEKVDHSNITIPVNDFRNKVINGDFPIWQRGTTQTASGYGSADRWMFLHGIATKSVSLQSFALGQTDVPGNPTYFCRTVVTAGSNSAEYVIVGNRIESVSTLAGKTATLTFYAKADAPKNMSIEINQSFGTGGSPSVDTAVDVRKISLTTSWQKISYVINVPSIISKTLGSSNNDFIQILFWFDAGSNFNTRTSSLGNQSGTFDIARVSLVEGDATGEFDPFSPRHIGQELALCQRYYYKILGSAYGATYAGSNNIVTIRFPVRMQAQPTVTQTLLNNTGLSTYISPDYVSYVATGVSFNAATAFTADAEL